jgi:hypothetical protein
MCIQTACGEDRVELVELKHEKQIFDKYKFMKSPLWRLMNE